MLGKDQKGYVMSGFGLLLLIPVMIIIPVMLAVETQSGDLPNKFTQSDTVYRTFQDIKTDLRNQMFILGYKIDKKTFSISEEKNITDAIDAFYASTNNAKYQNTYDNNFVYVNVAGKQAPSIDLNQWNENGGTASLNNGYILTFARASPAYSINSNYHCNYTMKIQANTTITVTQGSAAETGHTQDYIETYVYYFVVKTNQNNEISANNTLSTFFHNIGTHIYNKGYAG
jgi:hypothetical protein